MVLGWSFDELESRFARLKIETHVLMNVEVIILLLNIIRDQSIMHVDIVTVEWWLMSSRS